MRIIDNETTHLILQLFFFLYVHIERLIIRIWVQNCIKYLKSCIHCIIEISIDSAIHTGSMMVAALKINILSLAKYMLEISSPLSMILCFQTAYSCVRNILDKYFTLNNTSSSTNFCDICYTIATCFLL